MSWVEVPGGVIAPAFPGPAISTSGVTVTVDATAEKMAIIGRVDTRGASRTITAAGFRASTMVSAGGSKADISLQNVSTSGPPMQPDGTKDQTANVLLSSITASAFNEVTFGSSRTVADGDLLALVIEFDAGGRLGSDSMTYQGLNQTSGSIFGLDTGAVFYDGVTWAIQNGIPSVAFKDNAGEYYSFYGLRFPFSTGVTTAFNSGSSPPIRATEFTVPFPVKIDALYAALEVSGSSADFNLFLDENGTEIASTATVDANSVRATGNGQLTVLPITEQILMPGRTYRSALRPTTANNVSVYGGTVSNAKLLDLWPGTFLAGANLNTQAGGTWGSPTTTARQFSGVRVSHFWTGYPASRVHLGM